MSHCWKKTGRRNLANEQAIQWLKSMMNSENPFDSINAGNCLALIDKQKKALVSLGAHFCNLKKQRDRYASVIAEAGRISNDSNKRDETSQLL
jgi:hypothetical protein